MKPGTTLGLLAGPPERPEPLPGGGALSGGAPPPEAIDLMGINVAPPEAGDGEGGDAPTPWFSGQDALGVRELVAHAEKRRRDGGEPRRTEASVRAEPPAPNWKLARCPDSDSASSGFPPSSRGRARAIIGVPQWPPGAVHRARPTRRWCRRSGSRATRGSPARGTPAERWAAEAFGGEGAMGTPGRDRGRCRTRSADRTRGLLLQREGVRDRERGTGWQGEGGHDVGAARGAARKT